jgi:DNA-binding PadR family transcriptional regulator
MSFTPHEELLPLTPLQYHILVALASGPLSGYNVRRQILTDSQGMMAPSHGSLYPALHALSRLGFITQAGNGRPNPGRPRRVYRLTTLGEVVLETETARLEANARLVHERLAIARLRRI